MANNYQTQNLLQVAPSDVPAGTLAIKIGDTIFTAGSVTVGQTAISAFQQDAMAIIGNDANVNTEGAY